MTVLAPAIEDASSDHREDLAAIRHVIADVQAGFNTKDPELSVAHFAENASSVSVVGVQLTGRDALIEANRTGLAGFLSDQFARYELADVTFLRPDVAVAHKHAWATTPDGELLDVGHAMNALYVLVKQDDRWWITARQNTLVPTRADVPG
jgi:uncharacterized protein (TIGR02246 family)